MIGPLTVAPGGFNHVLVAVDKFTKWIEYKPIVKISSDRAVDFISPTSFTGSDFLIPSSQILAQTLHCSPSGTSVTILASKSSMLQ